MGGVIIEVFGDGRLKNSSVDCISKWEHVKPGNGLGIYKHRFQFWGPDKSGYQYQLILLVEIYYSLSYFGIS